MGLYDNASIIYEIWLDIYERLREINLGTTFNLFRINFGYNWGATYSAMDYGNMLIGEDYTDTDF